VEEPKKPALGDVRLATPSINRGKSVSTPGDSEPSIDLSTSASNAAPLSTLSGSQPSMPAAPVPIGGDVKPAKLLKSVQPVYPQMARTQHVSGNVQIDALIDADGNVGAMKVLSGPALLRDAALQSLKQWKYQPAELDGKPTSMHLTVVLQFRAQ
jgi:TonB family protein